MNSLDVIKNIYKPYRYTIKGKSTIINTTSGNYVIKEKEKDIKELYSYLISRDFSNFPKLIDDTRRDINVFEYIEDTNYPSEQKSLDLIKLVSNLHHKTSYYKEVTIDRYQTIYETIDNNILFLQNYYNRIYDNHFHDIFYSPSINLFLQSNYKIIAELGFCKKELDEWFEIVKNESKERVALIHNNLDLSHYIKKDRDYLISWDKAKIDTPVLDLVRFYQASYLDLNFAPVLNTYLDRYPLNKQEQKLFFILISIPPKIEFADTEINNVKKIRKQLDYIFKTEKLIRPYYTSEEEK